MINVLFVESGGGGNGGGGSFESLYLHLQVMDRNRLRPIVVYLNHNRYASLVEELGIKVHVLTDLIHSSHAPRFARKVATKLRGGSLRLNRLVPTSSLRMSRLVHWPLVHGLSRVVRDENIDIIHLNVHIYRDLFGLFVSEKTGVPCISHLRSINPHGRHQFNSSMAWYANSVVSAYVANSAWTGSSWEERGIDAAKTRLVHNGIPTVDVRPLDVRKRWFSGKNASFVVGCVAPLRGRGKVDEFLIRGFASFLRRCSDAVLLVVGDGPMREVLAREAVTQGIGDRVVFAGFQARAKEILAGLDVSVIVPNYDSFSRVALETMQAGTPLLASDLGAIREIVEHEQNGLLVRYGDEKAFADVLERLLVDKELRTKLAENGYRTIKERFSIEQYASKIEDIYKSMLEDRVFAGGGPE